jgi:hypothetical protein
MLKYNKMTQNGPIVRKTGIFSATKLNNKTINEEMKNNPKIISH